MHRITARETRIIPDDGFILGNGDLSVSVYCDRDVLSFRLGKGDVWDRRLMHSADPDPVDVDEFKRGLLVEGWKCNPYGGEVFATRAEAQDPERMVRICQGSPESYKRFPSPCPKPTGTLDMYVNPDLHNPVYDFELLIEEAVLNVSVSFDEGYRVNAAVRIDPDENLLLVEWKTEGFPAGNALGGRDVPVRFALYRHADSTRDEYHARYLRRFDCSPFYRETHPRCTPLEPPYIEKIPGTGGHPCIVQHFQPDLTYPLGFECALTAFGKASLRPVDIPTAPEKSILIHPENPHEGKLYVGVETTGEDRSRAKPKLKRLMELVKDADSYAEDLARRLHESSEAFWSAASVETGDEAFERMWYETLHIHRSAYREGKQAPGLFLPSTVDDHSYWHGDYHTNYNIQSPFFGAASGNHPELLKPYIELMVKWFLPVGKYIAEKYYHCRGCFVQLTGYPMVMADDPLCIMPMGRMAYMTGFVLNLIWDYYRYTLDTDYLRDTLFPFIRECALFYHDFLTLEEDGLYHAFPSNQGEDGFTGNANDFRDSRQVMNYIHRTLYIYQEAAGLVCPEDELLPAMRERFEKLAPPKGLQWPELDALTQHRFDCSPPEFGSVAKPYQGGGIIHTDDGAILATGGFMDSADWYFGHMIDKVILPRIRNFGKPDHSFQGLREDNDNSPVYGDADYNFLLKMLTDWRQVNGTYVGMSRSRYGFAGVFTETLGITAALNEMLVQSFDGAIAPFPCWPLNKRAKFEHLRAEGAFLVSGACEGGRITDLRVYSEKGGRCAMYIPENAAITCEGAPVPLGKDDFGRPEFETCAGKEYTVAY